MDEFTRVPSEAGDETVEVSFVLTRDTALRVVRELWIRSFRVPGLVVVTAGVALPFVGRDSPDWLVWGGVGIAAAFVLFALASYVRGRRGALAVLAALPPQPRTTVRFSAEGVESSVCGATSRLPWSGFGRVRCLPSALLLYTHGGGYTYYPVEALNEDAMQLIFTGVRRGGGKIS